VIVPLSPEVRRGDQPVKHARKTAISDSINDWPARRPQVLSRSPQIGENARRPASPGVVVARRRGRKKFYKRAMPAWAGPASGRIGVQQQL